MPGSSPPPEVTALTALLANYTNALSVPTVTLTNLTNAGYAWTAITNFVLATPDQDVFGMMWVYFLSNESGILQESVVTQCFNTMDTTTRTRCELFYSLFQIASDGIDVLTASFGGVPITTSTLSAPALIAFLRSNAPSAPAVSLNISNAITAAQATTDVPIVVVPVVTTTNLAFLFPTPSTEWTIDHGLGRFPTVTIVDTSGDVVFSNIQYVDNNNITIAFGYPTSGTVYLT